MHVVSSGHLRECVWSIVVHTMSCGDVFERDECIVVECVFVVRCGIVYFGWCYGVRVVCVWLVRIYEWLFCVRIVCGWVVVVGVGIVIVE